MEGHISNRLQKLDKSPLQVATTTGTKSVPSVDEIIAEGQKDLIGTKQRSKECTLAWVRQAERIHILRDVHKLRGELLLRKGREIGFEKEDVYRLVRFYPLSEKLISICEEREKAEPDFVWPGLQTALKIAEGKSDLYGKFARAASQERETPTWLYNHFDKEFHFTCDASASATNHKHSNYFDKETTALVQEWQGVIWLNPPWNQMQEFTAKAFEEAQEGATVVMLVPLWSSEPWFLEYAHPRSHPHFVGSDCIRRVRWESADALGCDCVHKKIEAPGGWESLCDDRAHPGTEQTTVCGQEANHEVPWTRTFLTTEGQYTE